MRYNSKAFKIIKVVGIKFKVFCNKIIYYTVKIHIAKIKHDFPPCLK